MAQRAGNGGRGERGRKGTPPGNLYRCEYKALTKKGIRKIMKIKTFQIDRPRGAICKFMKTKEGKNSVRDGSLVVSSGAVLRRGGATFEVWLGRDWDARITSYCSMEWSYCQVIIDRSYLVSILRQRLPTRFLRGIAAMAIRERDCSKLALNPDPCTSRNRA